MSPSPETLHGEGRGGESRGCSRSAGGRMPPAVPSDSPVRSPRHPFLPRQLLGASAVTRQEHGPAGGLGQDSDRSARWFLRGGLGAGTLGCHRPVPPSFMWRRGEGRCVRKRVPGPRSAALPGHFLAGADGAGAGRGQEQDGGSEPAGLLDGAWPHLGGAFAFRGGLAPCWVSLGPSRCQLWGRTGGAGGGEMLVVSPSREKVGGLRTRQHRPPQHRAAGSLRAASSTRLTAPAPRQQLVAPPCPRQKVRLSCLSVLGEVEALHGDPSAGVIPLPKPAPVFIPPCLTAPFRLDFSL